MAVVVEWLDFFTPAFESNGWYAVDPGACREVLKGRVEARWTLSVTFLCEDGRRIADYGVDEPPGGFRRTGSHAIEEFYCVSDEPFQRRAPTMTRLTQCRDGEYLRLFNQRVFIRHTDEYTPRLR